MPKVNKDGQTLEEFLSSYDYKAFERPSYCADILVLSIYRDKPVALLVRRGNHPFIGSWALPGGFVNEHESSEECAARELKEETGISGIELEQLVTVSTPERDARGWNVATVYMGVTDEPAEAEGGDDADEAGWFYVDYVAAGNSYALKLKNIRSGEEIETVINAGRTRTGQIDINATKIEKQGNLAFDHAKVILLALERL